MLDAFSLCVSAEQVVIRTNSCSLVLLLVNIPRTAPGTPLAGLICSAIYSRVLHTGSFE